MMELRNNNGLTLIEVIVTMAIASIVMGVVVTTYQLQVRSSNTQGMLTDMNQSSRTALEIMSKEIRSAACDPTRTAGAQLVTANANQLSFTRDIMDTAGTTFEADGLVDGPNELVTYNLYVDVDGNQNLGRAVGAGAPQPLIRNVDALDFVYFNENGLPPATIADIRSLELTIVARSGEALPGLSYVRVDNTQYLNQQGTVIFVPPANDRFRRILLTTTVNLLNLW